MSILKGQIEMVWPCAEERQGIYRQKDDLNGATRQVVKRKTEKEMQTVGVTDERCRVQAEMDDSDWLLQLLKRAR